MNQNELMVLVQFFKVMADETRLKIVGLLCQREYNVGELASVLELSEPTVSHHLSKLRSIGLLNLRADGNQRFYRVNWSMLNQLNEMTVDLKNVQFDMKKSSEDKSWIDTLDMPEADKKVLRDYIENGRLKQIPMKQKKLMVVLEWLASHFEPDRMYTEREVNEIIKQYHEDFAGLRRDLVDFGYLRRERAGSKYWLTPEDEKVPEAN